MDKGKKRGTGRKRESGGKRENIGLREGMKEIARSKGHKNGGTET